MSFTCMRSEPQLLGAGLFTEVSNDIFSDSQVFMGLQVPTSSIISATCWLYFSILFPCVLIHMLSKVPQRCACQRAEAAASLRGNYGRRMLRCLSRDVSMACSSGTQWYEMLCGPGKRSNMIKAVPITKLKCISMLL